MTTMTRDQVLETVREAQVAGQRADLRDTDLRGVDLADADLTGADLTGADLTDANLTRAYLSDADLTRAYLSDADLSDADLTGATLTRTNLTDADLRGAALPAKQLLDTRGLRPGGPELPRGTWGELLPSNTEQRRLVEHLLTDGWGGTLREAVETVEGLSGR